MDLLHHQIILVTNAAGGLNPDYAVGDIVVLNDVGLDIPAFRRAQQA
jgi:purine nucleoside phosphorylase